jgi:prolyl 4-hydroxylase
VPSQQAPVARRPGTSSLNALPCATPNLNSRLITDAMSTRTLTGRALEHCETRWRRHDVSSLVGTVAHRKYVHVDVDRLSLKETGVASAPQEPILAPPMNHEFDPFRFREAAPAPVSAEPPEPGQPWTTISTEWVGWAEEQLRDGHDPDELFETLMWGGGSYADVAGLLHHKLAHAFRSPELRERESLGELSSFTDHRIKRIPTDYLEIYAARGLLCESEVRELLNSMIGKTESSRLSQDTGTAPGRTSQTYHFCEANRTPLSMAVQTRICDLLSTHLDFAEALQGQIYAIDERYGAHFDGQGMTHEFRAWDDVLRTGTRLWSLVIYLADSAVGSGTQFPRLDLELNPRQGDAVFWKNYYPSGNMNPYALHQGLPAGRDQTKIILTQWLRSPI